MGLGSSIPPHPAGRAKLVRPSGVEVRVSRQDATCFESRISVQTAVLADARSPDPFRPKLGAVMVATFSGSAADTGSATFLAS
jgi:hypothetical protein